MLVYKCGRCGYVLYEYTHLDKSRSGILSPAEVASRRGYKCPSCGAAITGSMNPDWREHIRVKPRAVAWK